MIASEVKIGKNCRIGHRPSRRIDWNCPPSPNFDKTLIAFVTDEYQLVFLEPDAEVGPSFDLIREGPEPAEDDQATSGHIIDLVKGMSGISNLRVITPWITERIKDLAAEILKPGSDEVITDTYTLDYIWDLSGDTSLTGDQIYHRRAIDYYLGRTVDHGMWVGKLMKIAYDYAEAPPPDKEWFGHGRVWLSNIHKEHNLPGRRIDYGIAIKFPCQCGMVKYDMFAIPGVHLGGFAYLVDEDTDSYLDIRNQCRVCEECGPKVRDQLAAIEANAGVEDD
jgi:hypothetical protein